jgi:hypothetical protein
LFATGFDGPTSRRKIRAAPDSSTRDYGHDVCFTGIYAKVAEIVKLAGRTASAKNTEGWLSDSRAL